jgi:hypothetical protein
MNTIGEARIGITNVIGVNVGSPVPFPLGVDVLRHHSQQHREIADRHRRDVLGIVCGTGLKRRGRRLPDDEHETDEDRDGPEPYMATAGSEDYQRDDGPDQRNVQRPVDGR